MDKDIIGFENYTVDEIGNVFSKNYRGSGVKKKMSWAKKDNGYYFIGLRKPKQKKKFFYIHRLVAIHFLDNKLNKSDVNHKDGNKENNSISNLEWCDSRENSIHAVENKLGTRGMKYKNNKSGFVGVVEQNGRYIASIRVNKKKIYLGVYGTAQEAYSAYKEGSLKYHGDSLKITLC